MTNGVDDTNGTNGIDGIDIGDDAVIIPAVTEDIAQNVYDPLALSDTGNGRRFADMYCERVRYVEDLNKWMIWQNPHWKIDESGLVVFGLTLGVVRAIRAEALQATADDRREALERYALGAESEKSRLRMLATAREHAKLRVMGDDLDWNDNLLAVPNGTVDLRTGKLRASAPDDLCTRVCKVRYVGDENGNNGGYGNALLDQYLETFVPDKDDQRVLFGILGTLLRGGNPTRMFPIFIGGTTSGKSQLLAAMEKLLGNYICTINVSVFRGNLDDKPRPDLDRAMHHRIAYAVEASKIWELHADQVKRITGGDAVPYRNLYSMSEQAIPRFTPLIVTNEMPRIKGADEALRRRMIIFPFDRTLPPALEDARIKERFINDKGCLEALLARIVEGARYEPLKDGVKWTLLPAKFASATMAGFGALDNIDEFLEWLGDRGIMQLVDTANGQGSVPWSDCVRTADLHKWYTHWIKEHGDKQDKAESLNHVTFNTALRTKGWRSVRSGAVRWEGVKLTASPGTWIMP